MTEPPVDELVQQAELRRRASQDLQRRIASIYAVARDPDNLIEAVATASGELKSLRLQPAALHRGVRWLSETIMATAHQAAEFARQRSLNQLALVLGDEAAGQLEGAMGIAPARAAGWDVIGDRTPTPQAPPRAPEEDSNDEDDIFSFDPSSLRSDR